MPRRRQPPRLYLRERAGREPVFVILDGGRETSTGCGAGDGQQAEEALQRYLAEKHRPDWQGGAPDRVWIAEVINHYLSVRAPQTASPSLPAYHAAPLLEFFGDKVCSAIDAGLCAAYVTARTSGNVGRKVKTATARRELETLNASIQFAYRDRKLLFPVPVSYPAKSPSRERWLKRSEVAALLAGALGFSPIACDVRTRAPVKWRRTSRPAYHVARFILVGLYTGTRHDAILRLGWAPNASGGHIDLEHGLIYRRGFGQAETNKRRTPARLPDRIIAHLRRWRRMTSVGPCEYEGRLIRKQRTGFEHARDRAGLGSDVVPHVLRHSCATWMLQNGETIFDTAGYLGASVKTIAATYGHHSPDSQRHETGWFRGPKLGRKR